MSIGRSASYLWKIIQTTGAAVGTLAAMLFGSVASAQATGSWTLTPDWTFYNGANLAKIQFFNAGDATITGASVLNFNRSGQIVGSVPVPDIAPGVGVAVDMTLGAITTPGGEFVIAGLPNRRTACTGFASVALVRASITSTTPTIIDEIPASQFEVSNPGGQVRPITCIVDAGLGSGAPDAARTTGPIWFAPGSSTSITTAEVAFHNIGNAPNTFGMVWVATDDGSIASQQSVTVDPNQTEVVTFAPPSPPSGAGEWFMPVVCPNGGTVSLGLNLTQVSVTPTGGTTATNKQFTDAAFVPRTFNGTLVPPPVLPPPHGFFCTH